MRKSAKYVKYLRDSISKIYYIKNSELYGPNYYKETKERTLGKCHGYLHCMTDLLLISKRQYDRLNKITYKVISEIN